MGEFVLVSGELSWGFAGGNVCSPNVMCSPIHYLHVHICIFIYFSLQGRQLFMADECVVYAFVTILI